MIRRFVVLPIVAAALVFGAGPAQAGDPTAVEFAMGSYRGFFLSSVTGENGGISFNLTEIHNRQLDGTLMVTGMQFPFKVTVGASHVFNAVGRGGSFVAHGMVEVNGDGSSISTASYMLGDDRGKLLFLHPIPTSTPAQLANRYTGTFTRDDGAKGLIIVVCRQEGSSFSGEATFTFTDPGEQTGMTVPYVATVGAIGAAGEAPIHVISLTQFVSLGADAMLNGNSAISGNVRFMFADGSAHTASFNLRPATPTEG